ncbi:MAG: hypothetical protein VYB89_12725, partial [Pseudomonadota bacterium]|nr:hypothetical protein [Pseudomonadota bacterium]
MIDGLLIDQPDFDQVAGRHFITVATRPKMHARAKNAFINQGRADRDGARKGQPARGPGAALAAIGMGSDRDFLSRVGGEKSG